MKLIGVGCAERIVHALNDTEVLRLLCNSESPRLSLKPFLLNKLCLLASNNKGAAGRNW